MSFFLTMNPVPSNDPRDLDDNSMVLDNLINATTSTTPDRLGVPRKTWYQVEIDAQALISPNVTGLSSLSSAANKGFYFTNSSGAMATYDLTAQARTFAAASTQAAQRAALQLGTAATLDAAGTGAARIAIDAPTIAKLTDGSWRGLGGVLDLRGTFLESGTPGDVTGIGFVTGFADRAALGIPSTSMPASAYVHLIVVTPYFTPSGNPGQTTLRIARAMGIEVVQYATSATTWSAWSEPNVRGGANSSITSLSGLTTALSTAQGGTGNTSGAAASLSTSRSITATGDGAWTVSFNGSSNVSAAFTLSSTGVSAGTYGSVTVDAKGRVTSGSVIAPISSGGTGVGATSMVNLTLQNSWAVFSGGRAAYRKITDDLVYLELRVTAGTATNGTVIATLPSGFRPPFQIVAPCASPPNTALSTTVAGPRIVINTDGTVTCENCTNVTIQMVTTFSLT